MVGSTATTTLTTRAVGGMKLAMIDRSAAVVMPRFNYQITTELRYAAAWQT